MPTLLRSKAIILLGWQLAWNHLLLLVENVSVATVLELVNL